MPPFHIGVGSNIDPEKNIVESLALLQQSVTVAAVSTFYWSDAVGKDGLPTGHSPYLNGVFVCYSDLHALDLKKDVLRPIESQLGRVRSVDKFADRPLDLDILLWGAQVVETEALRVPDLGIRKRSFVALPLYEVAGDIPLPGDDRLLKDVVEALDTFGLKPNERISKRLLMQLERN